MKAVLLLLTATMLLGLTRCPDGTWVEGNKCNITPDRTYVGGDKVVITPDRKYVGEEKKKK